MTLRRTALFACAAGAFALAACTTAPPASAPMAPNPMRITLSGAAEVPPNASGATGSAQVELEGSTLRWNISYANTTGPVTAAHMHGPAAPGANAGVRLPFKPPYTSPIRGEAQVTPEQVAEIKAGLWYINLHTAQFPGGELRGQVR